MIKYQLTCSSGHEFEAWFGSSAAFDMQTRDHNVTCPVCASTAIEKWPMAPAIVGGRNAVRPADALAQQRPASLSAATGSQETADALRCLKRQIIANTESVGDRFAEEARRIHFGESPERAIHGQATAEEARAMHEDGISFGILPRLPDEHN